MRVLVTGGAGYIGSHTVRLLRARGHDAVVFDNLSAGHAAAVAPGVPLVRGDLLHKPDVAALFAAHAPFDGVLHFASRIQVGESMAQPFLYLHDNVVGLFNLLEQATAHRDARFILSSTANLYDNPQTIPITEDEALAPGSVYGETKYIGERVLAWMHRIYGLRSVSLRYFNASGAHPDGDIGEDHQPETHLIPLVLQVALGQRDAITLYGTDYATHDGTAVRDYVHVMDLADAHLRALLALDDDAGPPVRAYNLGTGSGYSVQDVVAAARRVTGHAIPTVEGPRRAGDLPRLVADGTRAGQDLGWEPQYNTLDAIIATAWRWHSTHPRGYDDATPKEA